MTPDILRLNDFTPGTQALLDQSFRVHTLPPEAERETFFATVGPRIRGIATFARSKVGEDMMARLPALEIIACHSAGMEGIDMAAAERRGIAVTNTSGLSADDVADHAFGLIIAGVRNLFGADRHVRSGSWAGGALPLVHRLKGRRLGIIGLGMIGQELARRAEASRMEIAYTGPRPKPDQPYRYFPDAVALAEWAEVLAATCIGGPSTRHLINAQVLAALGPEGFVVNVARGTVVDEAALLAALNSGAIAGAGLDVFENEPKPSGALIAAERLIVSPHSGSGTLETKADMGRSMVESLRRKLLPQGVAATA